MARKKRPSRLRPKTPARVRKRRRRARSGGSADHRHPELAGLGLIALGAFLGAVFYAGWNGGYVGGWLSDGLQAVLGDVAYAVPVAFVLVGGLMLARSALVDMRPFKAGLSVLALGLMLVVGGGY